MERPGLHDPARLLATVGAIVAIIASPLPWMTRVGNPPPQVRTGWSSTADGFLLAVVAAALLVLALSGSAATTRSRGLRLLPGLLGVVAGIFGFGAWRALENQDRIWRTEGAQGVYEPWFFLALIGAALATIGGLWLGWQRARAPGIGDSTDELRVTPTGVARTLLGFVGVIVGAGAVAFVILNSGLNDVAMSMPLLFGTLAGGLFGAYVGGWLGRILFDAPPPMAAPRDPAIRIEKVGGASVARQDRGRREGPTPLE